MPLALYPSTLVDITALDTRVTTLETDVGQLETDLTNLDVTQSGLNATTANEAGLTNTSYANVAGTGPGSLLAVSLTTTGGDVDVDLSMAALISTGSGHNMTIGISLDSTTEVADMPMMGTIVNATVHAHTFHTFTGVSAGAHTVKARVKFSGGTWTLIGGSCRIRAIERKL